MQKLFRSLIAVGGLAGLAACGDDVSITPPNNPLLVSGAPVTAVQVGATIQLSANKAATWASSASNVASVDANGLVTAASAGTASITATSTADVTEKASVTITVTAPAVRSVTVQPGAVTMNPGGTQGFVANIDADPGVPRTVAWSSSDNNVVTINAASGVATAVAPGAATVTATVGGVTGAAAVTVRTPTQASVTIEKVTVGNTNVPVNFLAVVGQMDITVNVDPGDFVLSKVELQIDGVTCEGCTQTFTAEESQALSAAAVYGADVAGAVSQILFSVQTSQFDPTTGIAKWLNKTHTISAVATLTSGGQTSTASSNRDMTFANVNTWVASLAFTGTTASATGTAGTSAGLAFRRGGMTVTALPVIYNEGQSVVSAGGVVNFGGVCDANGTGTRTVSLTGSGPYTAVFPQATGGGVTTATSVSNYEFGSGIVPVVLGPNCASLFPNGESPVLTAVDNAGNNIFSGVGPCIPGGVFPVGQFCPNNSVAAVRLDNRAPGAPQFAANPNNRQNGWINATVGLNGSNTSTTDNDWIINGTADAGIGGGLTTGAAYQRWLRIGDGTAATVADARAATASDAATLPAPSVTSTSLCAIATSRDQLGNESALPAATTNCLVAPFASFLGVGTGTVHLMFGVDIAPPTAVFTAGSIAADARINGGALGNEFIVALADTGAVGNSGMLGGAPLVASVVRRHALGTILPADCVVGTVTSGVCTQSAVGVNGASVPINGTANTTTLAGQVVPTGTGYYTFDGTAFDAAGNSTAVANRVAVYDNTPATATAPAVPATITTAFSAAAFLNDDLSIRDYMWTAQWNTALLSVTTATIAANPTVVDAYNAPTLSNINFGINASINTFLGLQNGQGATPVAYVAGSNPMNFLHLFVRDQTQAAYTGPASSAVAPTIPATAGVSVTNFTGAYTAATSNASICAGTTAVPCGAVPITTNFTATASGATAVFNNPFTRVDFYAVNAAGTNLVLIGSVPAAAATLVDNGILLTGRVWTYTLPMTAASLYATLGGVSPAVIGPVNVYAFGASPAGPVALVSAAVAQTINP